MGLSAESAQRHLTLKILKPKPARRARGGAAPRSRRSRAPLGVRRQDWRGVDDRPEERALLASIKAALPALKKLLAECNGHWCYEDGVYRFYHGSFKVYHLQQSTEEIVAALRALAPERPLNETFLQIVADGTGKIWEQSHNQQWEEITRPILEAFFHARYFLEMVVRYGKELKAPPAMMPSGWAAVLYLYGLR